MLSTEKLWLVAAVLAMLAVSGCGSSTSSGGAAARTITASGGATSSSGAAGGAGALAADSHSAATGDIPDNQAFLVFHNAPAGYSMKYPEGWTQLGSGPSVMFENKNDLVHVTITHAPAPSPASVTAQLLALKRSNPTLAFQPPQSVTVGSAHVVKAVYTTESAPNAVTGKRVLLTVDRYELARAGKVAIVDLGTPIGVDNVDAYRMMINSFRWL